MSSFISSLSPSQIPFGDALDVLLVKDPDKAYYKRLYTWALVTLPSSELLVAIAAQRIKHLPLTLEERDFLWLPLKHHLSFWRDTETVVEHDVISCNTPITSFESGLGSAPYIGGLHALDWYTRQSKEAMLEQAGAFLHAIKEDWFDEMTNANYLDFMMDMAEYTEDLTDWLIPMAWLVDGSGLHNCCRYLCKAFIRSNKLEDGAARMAARVLLKRFHRSSVEGHMRHYFWKENKNEAAEEFMELL